MAPTGGAYVQRSSSGGLYEVIDVILDKGLVIDAFVRVSLVGIELLTIDARIVVAGVDTYLHFAEAVNRLDLLQADKSQNLGDMVGGGMQERAAESKTKGVLQGARDSLLPGRSNERETAGRR